MNLSSLTKNTNHHQKEQVLIAVPLDTYLQSDINNKITRENIKQATTFAKKSSGTSSATKSLMDQLKKISKRNNNITNSSFSSLNTSTDRSNEQQQQKSITYKSAHNQTSEQQGDDVDNNVELSTESSITWSSSPPWIPTSINTTKRKRSRSPIRLKFNSKLAMKGNKILSPDQLMQLANVLCSSAKIPSTLNTNELDRRQIYAEFHLEQRLRRAVELTLSDIENKFG